MQSISLFSNCLTLIFSIPSRLQIMSSYLVVVPCDVGNDATEEGGDKGYYEIKKLINLKVIMLVYLLVLNTIKMKDKLLLIMKIWIREWIL